MHLYSHLDKLGERALYCDTDCVIFVQKDGKPPLVPCGDALGEMTSELQENEYISEFVSGGPKNYAYKLCNSVTVEEKTVCKVRGVIFNYKASQLVNFDRIKELVLNGRSNSTVTDHTDKKIKRKRGDGACVSIITETEDNIYRIAFFKRRLRDDNTLVPFGY